MNRQGVSALVSGALLLISSLCVAQGKVTYKLTQIGTNNSTTSTFVTGMNDEGALGLTVSSGSNTNVFLWRHGTTTNIGGLSASAPFVEGGALNDLVQVVGSTPSPQSGDSVGFVWQLGRATQLPSPANSVAVFTSAINLLGQIAGQAYDENFISHAVVWNRGQVSILPGLPNSQFTEPVGINLQGEIAGVSYDENEVPSAVIWRKGVLTVALADAMPNGLNDLGQIVGFSNGAPFIWEASTVTLLPLIGSGAEGAAEAINDWGQIVGSQTTSTGTTEAVLWQGSGASVVNLNTLVSKSDPLRPYVTLASGTLINNLGQIVATGNDARIPDFQQYYLLTPNL
jgi:probable HAF family extracellular repeat protein